MKLDPYFLERRGWISTAESVHPDDPLKTCVCCKCKTDKFEVGQNKNYQTVIKCPNCGWEEVIHDG